MDKVSSNLSPILEHPLTSIAEVDEEIMSVVSLLHQAAVATIPTFRRNSKAKNFIRNDDLKQKCQASKSAWNG